MENSDTFFDFALVIKWECIYIGEITSVDKHTRSERDVNKKIDHSEEKLHRILCITRSKRSRQFLNFHVPKKKALSVDFDMYMEQNILTYSYIAKIGRLVSKIKKDEI